MTQQLDMLRKPLDILTYPNPILRQKSKKVLEWSNQLSELVANMQYTMEVCGNSVGLSAIQVGVPLQIFLGKMDGYYTTFVNPEILESQGEYSVSEGCLSFPEIYDAIPRAKYVFVGFSTIYNGSKSLKYVVGTYKDLDAIIIQHELDHLNGVLMYDHVTPQYRKRIDKKFKRNDHAIP